MSTKKNGRSLEQLVAAVQATIAPNEQVQIFKNYKVKNKNDIEREFDVWVETIVQKTTICIAIECKDYKSKVSVEKVDAFNTKCLDVPQINKKIMVSPKGFQSGARKTAEKHGIELYTLDDVPIESILGKYSMNNLMIRITPMNMYLFKSKVPFIDYTYYYEEIMHVFAYPSGEHLNFAEILYNEINRQLEDLQAACLKIYMRIKQETFYVGIEIPGKYVVVDKDNVPFDAFSFGQQLQVDIVEVAQKHTKQQKLSGVDVNISEYEIPGIDMKTVLMESDGKYKSFIRYENKLTPLEEMSDSKLQIEGI